MDSGRPIDLKDLRFPVVLARRVGVADSDAGILDQYEAIQTIHAAIKPLSLQSFIGAEQIDMGMTHRVYFRWQPFHDLDFIKTVILREMILPDGARRTEIYRIQRVSDFQEKHRFIVAECTLEKAIDH